MLPLSTLPLPRGTRCRMDTDKYKLFYLPSGVFLTLFGFISSGQKSEASLITLYIEIHLIGIYIYYSIYSAVYIVQYI